MNEIPIVDPERVTQNRIINLLHDHCGYQYLGYKSDEENEPYIDTILRKFLVDSQGLSHTEIDKVLRIIDSTVHACYDEVSLNDNNLKFYEFLRYGIELKSEDGYTKRVWLINWKDTGENIFSIAEEVTVRRNIEEYHTRRPDVVVYVNGLALAVLELKKSTVSAKEGIRQQIRNNKKENEICHFFVPAQFLLAGNDSEGVHYGTILTPEKFWLRWKEPTGQSYPNNNPTPDPVEEKYTRQQFPNELDRSLLQLLDPERLLELIHDCVIYDGGIKKVCRPNQYFAFKAAKPRLLKKQNGIIWHSQGAGKSLMMVWLAQWILENIQDSRVVIITDRDELDTQIHTGFQDAGFKPVRAKSGQHLLNLLSLNLTMSEIKENVNPQLICTLIHKFGIAGQEETTFSPQERKLRGTRSPEQYMDDLAKRLPQGFVAKGNMFVFIDECHRTQGGILNKAMKKIMGENVMLIGFTGTPLLKNQKSRLTSRENFGNYIHTYKFNEAVADKVVLDLRYEAREVEQLLEDEASVDQLFNHLTQGLTQKGKDELQKRWAVMKNLFTSKDRINKIVADIMKDMSLIPCLRDGWGNAMLVCDSVYQAFRFWEAFQGTALKNHCAVVTSFDGKEASPDESSSGETQSEAEFKSEKAKLMFNGKTPDEFEAWAKNEFIKHPGSMKLLIVVCKLLTGFDAPTATYLYLDKVMKDQDLFQSICRVNRPNNEREDKEFGYIVDYKQLFKNIENAISDYTNGAFSNFDKEDVEGLLNDRFEHAKRDLDSALERVAQLCEPVALPKTVNEFFDYFVFDPRTTPADEEEAATIRSASKRDQFYQAVRILITRYSAIALEMERAGYIKAEAEEIYEKVKNFDNIMSAIMRRAGDVVDMKHYDQQMRQILDTYVEAKHSKVLAELDDFSFLDLVLDENIDTSDVEEELGGEAGVASTITANVRRVVNRKRESNPEEYRKFSERINRLLEEYRQGVLEYKDYLKGIAELAKELRNRTSDPRLDTPGKQALFDCVGNDVEIALELHHLIVQKAPIGFRTNGVKRGKLLKELVRFARGKNINVDAVLGIAIHNPEF